MKRVVAARSTEIAAHNCVHDYDIMKDDDRHIFSILEICNKPNKFFCVSCFIQCIC